MSLVERAAMAAACAYLFPAGAVCAAPPPIEAFGQKPTVADVDLNPSGTRLAWIEDHGKTARIVIHDLATNQALRSVGASARTKLWGVVWANDDTVIIDESTTQTIKAGSRDITDEWQRWVALDASGGEDRLLLMNDANREWVTGASVERRFTADPRKIFMSSWDWSAAKEKQAIGTRLSSDRRDSGWTRNLYEVDLHSGSGKLVASGTPYTYDWLVDDTGKLVVRSEFEPKNESFSIHVKDGGGWRKLYDAKGCGVLSLSGYSADKTAAMARGAVCSEDRSKLWSIPLDGTPIKAVFEDTTLEVEGVLRDPLDGQVLGVRLGGPEQPWKWLDARAEKRSAALHRSFGAGSVSVVGRSKDNQRVVVHVEDGSHPPIYYLVDYAAKKADIINEAYPMLNGVRMGAVRSFDYQARDKYPLMGYLTLPPESSGKNLPLVVMPHGGPEARDDPGFDWMAQFLASRGYAVLQPQFRGSTGLGKAHADAGRRQWGLRMQDDVSDGVQALITQGIADPKRVCIVGWSYGGYSALAGAAFTPDLYACAVSIAGISNLPAMLAWDTQNSGGRESNSFQYWRDHIGPASDENVIAKSPVRAASAVRAPVLLIHGVDDTVVPISQSREMAKALKANSKPVELVELAGEDHWMKTSSASRIRTLTELERFLGKYLGAAPVTAAN
jgi:dipeptidyl aminopeptidase/acylaminoacyl peptidase